MHITFSHLKNIFLFKFYISGCCDIYSDDDGYGYGDSGGYGNGNNLSGYGSG